MQDDYLIQLNFLPVKGIVPTCRLYRRRCESPQEQRPFALATACRLPCKAGDTEGWEQFWVALEGRENFEPFEFNPAWNPGLTRRVLFASLIKSVETVLRQEQYWRPTNEFVEEVSLIMETHPEGDELLVIQPYSLRASHQIGFLVDFRFHLREGGCIQSACSAIEFEPDQKLSEERRSPRRPKFENSSFSGNALGGVFAP